MQINSNYSIFKRLSNLVLLILCVIVAVNLYLMHSRNAQQWYQVESEQLGRSLTSQAAKLIAAPLSNNNQDLITQYVDVLNQGVFVTSAVLFNDLGVRLAQQEERPATHNSFSVKNNPSLIFIEDVVFEGVTIGYLKVVLDQQAVIEHHIKFNQSQLSQSILVILLSVVAAMLATRLFYKLRNSYKFDDGESL